MFFVILAGGSGTRFWPLSTPDRPKQFIDLTGDGSLLRLTYDRISDLTRPDHVFVLTGEKFKDLVHEHLPEVPVDNIICEPVPRNTAPCIAVAAMLLAQINPDEVMVVLPADQLIKDVAGFHRCLKEAESIARVAKGLVTLGISPTHPETGFGYIEADTNQKSGRGYAVKAFHEKPQLEKAMHYLTQKNYFWNAGIFIWKVSTLIEALNQHLPELMKTLVPLTSAIGTDQESSVLKQVFPAAPSISIDYGVMEKADAVFVVPASFDWSDVGSWPALDAIHAKDSDGNICVGHVKNVETKNTMIVSDGGPVVATLGVENLIIVSTKAGVLVCHKDRAQDIKRLAL